MSVESGSDGSTTGVTLMMKGGMWRGIAIANYPDRTENNFDTQT